MKPAQRLQQERMLRLQYGLDEYQASKMLDHILGGCSRLEEERKQITRVSPDAGHC